MSTRVFIEQSTHLPYRMMKKDIIPINEQKRTKQAMNNSWSKGKQLQN